MQGCKLNLFLLIIVSGIILSSQVFARIYYVDGKNGHDSNSGLQRVTALQTIQCAAVKMSAGDSCLVIKGAYDERIRVTCSGHENAPIVFKSEGTVSHRGFTIEADYIDVIGFEIAETIDHWKDGVGIFVQGKGCEIKNNFIHDVTRSGIFLFTESPDVASTSKCFVYGNVIVRAGSAGITVYGQNHRIEENDISHTLQHPPKCINQQGTPDADGIRFFGSGHLFKKNTIHDILMSDPGNIDPHIDCFQTWGPAHNIIFEQNICDNPNDGMQGFMISNKAMPVNHIVIRNNILAAFRIINAWNCEYLEVYNNSFKSELAYTMESGYGIELHDSPYARIENNLFFNVGRHEYSYLWKNDRSERGLLVGFNCVYLSDDQNPGGNPWPNDLWQVNPKIYSSADNNFRLRPESPLIDMGKLTELTFDFDGSPRPQGRGMDIGAFEYQSPSPPDSVVLKAP